MAEAILPLIQDVERELKQQSNSESGEMRIAVECHTCYDCLIPAMDVFRNFWPNVELDIVSGDFKVR